MSTTTPNLGLTVPAMGDQISSTIPALGTNFQTLDNQVGTNTNQIGILSGSRIYVENYPRLSGETDDAPRVKRALADAVTYEADLYFASKSYTMSSSSIAWDSSKHALIGQGNTVLDFSGLSTGFAINVIGQDSKSSSYGNLPTMHPIRGMKINGPDSDSTTVDGFNLSDITNGSDACFQNIYVFGFRDQVYFGNNVWAMRFSQCQFGHAHRYILNVASGTSNSGENYSFVQCSFFSSTNASANATAVYVNKNSDLYFYACSFDYNDIEINQQNGIVNLIGCHVEDRSTGAMIRITYNAGQGNVAFMMQGGSLGPTNTTTTDGRDHLIELTTADNVSCDLYGVDIGTYGKPYEVVKVISGTPMIRIRGGQAQTQAGVNAPILSKYNNLLRNGDFELGNINGWTAGGSFTYSAQNTTVYDGTYSLNINGTGTVATSSIRQNFSVRPGENIILSYIHKSIITAGYVQPQVVFTDQSGATVSTLNVGSQMNGTQDWIRYGTWVRVPKGATQVSLQFYVNGLNGNYYLDDVVLDMM